MVGLLADDEQLALERVGVGVVVAALDENLADHRLDGLDTFAQARSIDRHVAPAQKDLALVGDGLGQHLLAGFPGLAAARQEHHADAIIPRLRQVETGARLPEEGVGDLHQDPGAVAGQRVRADGAPVIQVDEDLQALLYDLVAFAVLDIHDESDAAGVAFAPGIEQVPIDPAHPVLHGLLCPSVVKRD